ncbi:hypothetical protein UFOVP45_132 [uncultured Caudovirales phage]|uniref:Uncharacterized protein n=1 Tax=uncultured Caudovirales phage TaxID=2100421 RepID=A0A6J5KQ86_9CAUD|nr:hypothetical protein UFOVP45_132 [uncultured Caudovirales phage]
MGLLDHFHADHEPANPAEATFLGKTAPLRSGDQTNGLYKAERLWRSASRGGKSIGIGAARDLIGEIVHSKQAENFPGIEKVREAYKPENIQLMRRDEIGGIAATHKSGLMRFSPTGLTLGAVTHEASHLLHQGQFGHDWPMARAHGYLAHHFIGTEDAKALGEAYARGGIDLGK